MFLFWFGNAEVLTGLRQDTIPASMNRLFSNFSSGRFLLVTPYVFQIFAFAHMCEEQILLFFRQLCPHKNFHCFQVRIYNLFFWIKLCKNIPLRIRDTLYWIRVKIIFVLITNMQIVLLILDTIVGILFVISFLKV